MCSIMDALLPFVFFVLGAILASFLGVVAGRLYTGQSWLSGRSQCDSCGRMLGVLDLVPVVSWVSSLGRCRSCGSQVSYLYSLTEVTLGTLFVVSYLQFGLGLPLLLFLGALLLLTFIVLYDLRHTVVPPLASWLFVACAALFACVTAPSQIVLGLTFITAGAIGLLFFLLFLLSRGRAMGLGDTPVALGLSLLAGSASLAGLLFSFWIGALLGIAILVTTPKGHRMGIEVPFVPFLAAGFLLALFTGWNPLFIVFF